MKKTIITLIVIAAIGGSAWAYFRYRGGEEEVKVSTLAVTRGEIIESVGASGTLEAVTTVLVGTQVSGIIQNLYADFNSIVRKGQVIARLDPSSIETQLEQSRANLIRSQADLERQRVATEDAKSKLARAESLAKRSLISDQDLEAAQVALRSAEASLKSSQAALSQSQASLGQQEVNLQHTVIEAPIDGIVISRDVDVGQTVAASMSAPTLFVLAADLTKMRVNANVDESDVGRIRPGQHVRFRVDAYPTEEFTGTVSQVRLQPITVQNVVTYATVIDVPNPQLKLKPGMTANVTIEIAKRENALRIPAGALRFRPSAETFAALKQEVPPDLQRMAGGAGGRGGGPGQGGGSRGGQGIPPADGPSGAAAASRPTTPPAPTAAAPAPRPSSSPNAAPSGDGPASEPGSRPGRGMGADGAPGGGRGGFGGGQGTMTDAERQQRMAERMKTMTPEERAQFEERMRARGGNPAGAGRQGGRSNAQPATPARQSAPRTEPPVAAQTIDQLFGALPTTESRGRAWLYVGGQLKPVSLRLGITDGTYTELISGELQAGQELVTSVTTPAQAASGGTRSPLMPGRGGMPGGGRGR